RISTSLKSVAMLWSEFVSEIRWFWEQCIPIPRLPAVPRAEGGGIGVGGAAGLDMECCLVHQKLQLLNVCIAKLREEREDPSIDKASDEFDLDLLREAELSSLNMMGTPDVPEAPPNPSTLHPHPPKLEPVNYQKKL
ncbi:hypothetical protein T484DRAFT_1785772, partial [Baffinella frigidus]